MHSLQLLRIPILLVAVCLADGLRPAAAGELLPAPRPIHRLGGRLRPPGPVVERHVPTVLGTSGHAGGYAGADHSAWYGEAMGVPTFNWGYFGVNPRPYRVTHGSYYGEHYDWGVRRGF